jgi:hypothetical protein
MKGCLCVVGLLFLGSVLAGCVAFEPPLQSTVEDLHERPVVAVLPMEFELPITKLSYVKTVEGTLSEEEEATQVAEALDEIRQEARWLLLSRLAAGQGFRFVSIEETDALALEFGLKPGVLPDTEQIKAFKKRLGADLVIVVNILDYGKVRWQWLAAGMFADILWETIVIGLATAWNPGIILANFGFELLTSTPLWFGGGYIFGIAMRPVRVEARAYETIQGWPIWQAMEESIYAWGALKLFPETLRERKELQLQLNMAEIMESLGDSLTHEEYRASQWKADQADAETLKKTFRRERREPT